MSVSVGRAVHMLTGRDWERVGIAPAIAVPADQALARAQAEAMTVLASELPVAERAEAERLATFYRAQANPVDPGHPLADYAGRYGGLTLALDSTGVLSIPRAGRPALRLLPVGPDRFAPEVEPTQLFRFIIGPSGISGVDIDSGSGEPTRIARAAG